MKLNFDKLAEEYGLEIVKSDYGRYKQWKNADVDLFLPGRVGGCYMLNGVFPPDCAICKERYETLSLWSDLRPDPDGHLSFHRHEPFLCNDTFNERYIREEIEKALKVIEEFKKSNGV